MFKISLVPRLSCALKPGNGASSKYTEISNLVQNSQYSASTFIACFLTCNLRTSV